MLRQLIADMHAAGEIYIVQQITAKARKCPECGNTEFALMPTDFETAKCTACGKIMDAGGPGSGRKPEGIVRDFLQHVAKGAASHDALKGREYYRRAMSTHAVMKEAGKKQAALLMPPEHKAWLQRAHENYDISTAADIKKITAKSEFLRWKSWIE